MTATSAGTGSATEITMLGAINGALRDEMARDERVMVLGEDVGLNGGVFRATEGLQAAFGADRVVDTPLAEGVIIGSSIGLAVAGLVPVPEIQFLGFSYQAFHQIAGQLARYRYRSQGTHPMQVTVRAPYGGGVRTPELHSDAIESQLANCAGLKIVCPAGAADAKGLLTASIRDPDPVMFLEPLRGYRLLRDDVPDGEHVVPLGQARTLGDGDDLAIVAWSFMVEIARRAAERLAADGIGVTVVDLRTLVPLDVDTIAETVSRCGRAVVVQEAPQTAGFAAEVMATIAEECFYDLEAPVERVCGWDVPYPVAGLEDDYIPDVDRVLAAARRVLDAAP
ncbi:MAG: alpha-ketoacid dehydrogenase subunit beta [Actinomycetota bacterium]|nr:alpha-ketoacid dehydrogenase subunit beta [Actinomycetota bacterium]